MSKRIDETYTDVYFGGVTINPLAVLKEEIQFVDGETNEDYFPDTGFFYFDRPDLNKRFVLQGTFEEEQLNPDQTVTLFLYARKSGTQDGWLTPSGADAERPVVIYMNQEAPAGVDIPITQAQLNDLMEGDYNIDVTVDPVHFAGNVIGHWVDGRVVLNALTTDTNVVFAYDRQDA